MPSLDDELDADYARGYTWDKVRKMDKAQRDLLGAAMAQRADANAIHAIYYGKGKRQKKHKGQADVILGEKVFKFQELCKELESFDKIGSPKPRGLMERLR